MLIPPAPQKATRPARPTRASKAEKRDYFVFDKDGQHYGPMPKDQATAFAKQLEGSATIQAKSLAEAGQKYRAGLLQKARGRSE